MAKKSSLAKASKPYSVNPGIVYGEAGTYSTLAAAKKHKGAKKIVHRPTNTHYKIDAAGHWSKS